MHPILARGGRLAMYLAAWSLRPFLIALLARSRRPPAARSLAIALPLALVYAFFCLSAWYVCAAPRSHTPAPDPPRSLTTLTASVAIQRGVAARRPRLAPVLPAVAPRAWSRVPGALRTLLFGFGTLLYLLSLAISYLLAAVSVARGGTPRARGAALAREAEFAIAAAQIIRTSCSTACTRSAR